MRLWMRLRRVRLRIGLGKFVRELAMKICCYFCYQVAL